MMNHEEKRGLSLLHGNVRRVGAIVRNLLQRSALLQGQGVGGDREQESDQHRKETKSRHGG